MSHNAKTTKQAASQGQQDLLSRLIQLGVLSAGAGGVVGTLGAMRDIHRPDITNFGSGSNAPSVVQIPAELKPAVLRHKKKRLPSLKLAETKAAGSLADSLPEPDNANVMTGSSIPLTAAALALPGLAVYGGFRRLSTGLRKRDQKAQLDEAKKQHAAALAQQYRNLVMGKAASVAEQEILTGIEELQKVAKSPSPFNDIMDWTPFMSPVQGYGSLAATASGGALGSSPTEGFNSLKGLGNLAMLATAITAGGYMHNRSQKMDPRDVMQKAIKERSRQRRTAPNPLIPQFEETPDGGPDVKMAAAAAGALTSPYAPPATKMLKKKRKKPTKFQPPSLTLADVLGGASVGSLALSQGIASDAQAKAVTDAFAAYKPENLTSNPTPGSRPAWQTGMTNYQATLVPAAQLRMFGMGVGPPMVAARQMPKLMDALGIPKSLHLDSAGAQGVSGTPHYRTFSHGNLPAYMHQLGSMQQIVPKEISGVDGQTYEEWASKSIMAETRAMAGGNNPWETEHLSNDAQMKILESRYNKLSPEQQAYMQQMEESGHRDSQVNNYMPPAKALLKAREYLNSAGYTLGGAGAGAFLGSSLYGALGDKKNKTKLKGRLATLAGAGLGGLAGNVAAGGPGSILNAAMAMYNKTKSAGDGSVSVPYGALLGAGIGGLGGGLADYLGGEDDTWWDGALGGAAAGGLAGAAGTAMYNASRPTKPAQQATSKVAPAPRPAQAIQQTQPKAAPEAATAADAGGLPSNHHDAISLGSKLPPDYRQEAQRSAEKYRDATAGTLKDSLRSPYWKQDISDAAIDRRIDVVDGKDSRARYYDRADTIIVPSGKVVPDSHMQRQVTHGSQHGYKTHKSQSEAGGPRYTSSVLEEGIDGDGGHDNSSSLEVPLTGISPYVEEAHLAEIKRDYFKQTGNHVRTPAEAIKALRWSHTRPDNDPEIHDLLDHYSDDYEKSSSPYTQPMHDEGVKRLLKALSEKMPGLVRTSNPSKTKSAGDGSVSVPYGALIGAGIGGLGGGLADYFGGEDDTWWDGALGGAAAGGLAGAAGTAMYNARRPTKPVKQTPPEAATKPVEKRPSSDNPDAISLGSKLPRSYRRSAQQSAEKYRAATADKNKPDYWKQDISDAAIDRRIDIEAEPALDYPYYLNYSDRIIGYGGGKTNPMRLQRQLTNAAQPAFETLERHATPGGPLRTKDMAWEVMSGDKHEVPNDTRDSLYNTSPYAEEAHLAEIKRDYFKQTGNHVTTPAEAIKALRWSHTRPGNDPDIHDLLDGNNRDSIESTNQNMHDLGVKRWLKALSEKMPGLVRTSNTSKTKSV